MLRRIRVVLAIVFFALITLLFLDFTGSIHAYFGWMAKIQFLPALLALNVAVVVALLVLTFLFGRLYCSVICPLGVMQDIFAFFGKKRKKNRYTYSPMRKWLRIVVLIVFLATIVAPGLSAIAHLIAPYSAYGRIASNIFAPIYQLGNNFLAYLSERFDSYAFYSVDVWIKSLATFIVAVVTFVVIAILAWRGGRTWCNTICPVGTILGFFAKYSLFKPVIDTEKCKSCGLCAKNCKASCINSTDLKIDYSRCVACFDCIESCRQGAIRYKLRTAESSKANANKVDDSRRKFLSVSALLVASAAVKAQDKKLDGGLAAIQDKLVPKRAISPKPAGSLSVKNFTDHCTACQLCVSACPNQVLRPSTDIEHLMQPEMSFERGHCRPECVRCSEVCPAGAIKPITTAEKSSISVGYAVILRDNCLSLQGVKCGNCERHCPVGAIQMVPSDANNSDSPLMPIVNEERCIGCGACENLCPVRPLSAIYVEGREVHTTNL